MQAMWGCVSFTEITKCVDTSITNFLEGKVSYIPEQIEKVTFVILQLQYLLHL